jgi:hypothetical protein
MTRAHAARQLLALGPLTLTEFVAITGWPYRACIAVLRYLRDLQEVRYVRKGNNHMTSIYEVKA